MKTILIALLGLTLNLHAADTVVVVSAASVTVNGEDVGKVADTIRNRPELASAIQRALEAWQAEQVAALAAARAKSEAAAAAKAELETKLKAAGSDADKLAKVRDEALQPELARRRNQIAAEIAAKQEELKNSK